MGKSGKKLLAALEEAVTVAKCDHELLNLGAYLSPSGYTRELCKKCGASFYTLKRR